jgi:hypothetical protein
MKKLTLVTILFLLTSATQIHAQTISPTVAPTTTITDSKNNDSLTEKINDLKDKIASRVAQLNLVEKRGIIGTVTERSATQITVKDVAGSTRSIDVDEITKFTSPGESNFGISDIEKNDIIGAVGIYNKQSRRILARYVDVINFPQILNGVVAKVDEVEFTITLTNAEEKNFIIDIEKVTKTNEYTKENGIEKSGFSDIRIGQRAIVTGYKDKDEENRITATRVLLFPEYPKDPNINVNISPEPTDTATPTPTPRGRVRASPSPTTSATR